MRLPPQKELLRMSPTLSQDPSDTGYLLTLRLPDGSNLPPPPPSLPPLEIPPVSGVRGWIEAASSLTKLVKGVSHQLGLWHICLSTPESPETTVVTRHVSSHLTLSFSLTNTKPNPSGPLGNCMATSIFVFTIRGHSCHQACQFSLPILSPLLHQSRYFLPSPDECYKVKTHSLLQNICRTLGFSLYCLVEVERRSRYGS